MIKTIEVQENQSLCDIALQEYGDIAYAIKIVEDNGLNGLLDNLKIGQKLWIETNVGNRNLVNYLMPFQVATQTDDSRGKGIGFWAIGEDFEVYQ